MHCRAKIRFAFYYYTYIFQNRRVIVHIRNRRIFHCPIRRHFREISLCQHFVRTIHIRIRTVRRRCRCFCTTENEMNIIKRCTIRSVCTYNVMQITAFASQTNNNILYRTCTTVIKYTPMCYAFRKIFRSAYNEDIFNHPRVHLRQEAVLHCSSYSCTILHYVNHLQVSNATNSVNASK